MYNMQVTIGVKKIMKMNIGEILILGILSIMLLSACGGNDTATEAPGIKTIEAQAMETLIAGATLTAVAQPQATNTTFALPSQTPTFGISTNTLQPSPTGGFPTFPPPPTQTYTPYSQGGTGGRPCLRAQFEFENYKDGFRMKPKELFTKQWRLTNSGSCTWNENFAVILVSETNISESGTSIFYFKDFDNFPEEGFQNGQTFYINIDMQAPDREGTFRSVYMLMDDNGQLFGINDLGKDAFWVEIKVRN
jgi:hypothetical protein